MGTRADFYVGRGTEAEWLGSIAWDGYPKGIIESVRAAATEAQFRERVAGFFSTREDVTLPEMGWPWPWNDSGTTDYAYAFDGDRVWASGFGSPWFEAMGKEPEEEEEKGDPATFPDMSARKNTTFGKRSGLLIFGA